MFLFFSLSLLSSPPLTLSLSLFNLDRRFIYIFGEKSIVKRRRRKNSLLFIKGMLLFLSFFSYKYENGNFQFLRFFSVCLFLFSLICTFFTSHSLSLSHLFYFIFLHTGVQLKVAAFCFPYFFNFCFVLFYYY